MPPTFKRAPCRNRHTLCLTRTTPRRGRAARAAAAPVASYRTRVDGSRRAEVCVKVLGVPLGFTGPSPERPLASFRGFSRRAPPPGSPKTRDFSPRYTGRDSGYPQHGAREEGVAFYYVIPKFYNFTRTRMGAFRPALRASPGSRYDLTLSARHNRNAQARCHKLGLGRELHGK